MQRSQKCISEHGYERNMCLIKVPRSKIRLRNKRARKHFSSGYCARQTCQIRKDYSQIRKIAGKTSNSLIRSNYQI